MYLLDFREQVLKHPWRHAAILIRLLINVSDVSQHCMRLATARLCPIPRVRAQQWPGIHSNNQPTQKLKFPRDDSPGHMQTCSCCSQPCNCPPSATLPLEKAPPAAPAIATHIKRPLGKDSHHRCKPINQHSLKLPYSTRIVTIGGSQAMAEMIPNLGDKFPGHMVEGKPRLWLPQPCHSMRIVLLHTPPHAMLRYFGATDRPRPNQNLHIHKMSQINPPPSLKPWTQNPTMQPTLPLPAHCGPSKRWDPPLTRSVTRRRCPCSCFSCGRQIVRTAPACQCCEEWDWTPGWRSPRSWGAGPRAGWRGRRTTQIAGACDRAAPVWDHCRRAGSC